MTRQSRSAVFLAIYSGAFVIGGLLPFDFQFDAPLRICPTGDWADITLNVVAFTPFGGAFAAGALTRRPLVGATIFCAMLSLCVECLQIFIPERSPQLADIVCNGAGASIGAWLWLRIAPTRTFATLLAHFERKLSDTH